MNALSRDRKVKEGAAGKSKDSRRVWHIRSGDTMAYKLSYKVIYGERPAKDDGRSL